MYGGPPRQIEGYTGPGSGNRSHHYTSHGRQSHEWREAPARRSREISYSQSSPVLGVGGNGMGLPLQGQEIPGESSPRAVSTTHHHHHHHHQHHQHQQQQTHTMPATVTVSAHQQPAPRDPEKYLMGELEDDSQSHMTQATPTHPLWQDGWRPSSIICTVPRLYQPSAKSNDVSSAVASTLDHPRDSSGNNLVLHCVDLEDHVQHLKAVVASLPSKPPQHMHPGSVEDLPPMPTQFYNPKTRKKQPYTYDPLGHHQRRLPPVNLDKKAVSLLLRKSTAAICMHSGYEASSARALDTLSDVLGDFLSKLCKVLRTNCDEQAESGSLGFQDALDQSLYQCGVGGKAALHKYWQTHVKDCAKRLQREAEECTEKYTRATEPSGGKRRSSVSAPSSLPLSRATRQDHFDIRLPSIWPAATPDLGPALGEEEIPLDMVMQHANLDIVLPTKTPDLGGPGVFSQFSENAARDSEGFTPLSVEGPPRKRLRTTSMEQIP